MGSEMCIRDRFQMMCDALISITYDDYDLLIQLCDSLALPEGFCLIEKRLVDVFLRYAQHGVDSSIHTKWQHLFSIQRRFEEAIDCSIYELLPGVVETTFGRAVSALVQR